MSQITPKENPTFRISESDTIKSIGLKKSAVVTVVCVIGALSVGTFLYAVNTSGISEKANASERITLGESLPYSFSQLPNIYQPEEKVVTKLSKVEKETVETVVEENDELLEEVKKLEIEYQKRRLRAKYAAKESDLVFTAAALGKRGKVEAGKGQSIEGLPDPSNLLSALSGMSAGAATSQPAGGGGTDANGQDNKISFLQEPYMKEQDYLSKRVRKPISQNEVKAGTSIPGIFLTGVNSDLPGQIVGQVTRDVYDTVSGALLLIPKGTKVIGIYDSKIVYGQERVLIGWSRLMFADGRSLQLENMPGTDAQGFAGVTGDVDNHYDKLISGVLITSILGATAQMSQGSSFNGVNPSFGQLAGQGVAQNMNQVGQTITQRNLTIQPTIIVKPGDRFSILVNKDMVVE